MEVIEVTDNECIPWDIPDVFSVWNARTGRIEYKSDKPKRIFFVELHLDTFRNISDDCFNMYVRQAATEKFEPFKLCIWIEGRSEKKYFYETKLVNAPDDLVWSVKRDRLLEKYCYLKTFSQGSEILPFKLKFEPASNVKEESASVENLEGNELSRQDSANEIDADMTTCKGLLEFMAKHTKVNFTLMCGDETFEVNYDDMERRCEGFARKMLSNSVNMTVRVDDMNSRVLAILLVHISSESLPSFPAELTREVFHASIKYKVPELATRSFRLMAEAVSEKDIVDLLSLTEQCNLSGVEFICALHNPERIFRSEAWSTFASSHRRFACDVYEFHFVANRSRLSTS